MFFLDCLVTETAVEIFPIYCKVQHILYMIESSIFDAAQRTLC